MVSSIRPEAGLGAAAFAISCSYGYSWISSGIIGTIGAVGCFAAKRIVQYVQERNAASERLTSLRDRCIHLDERVPLDSQIKEWESLRKIYQSWGDHANEPVFHWIKETLLTAGVTRLSSLEQECRGLQLPLQGPQRTSLVSRYNDLKELFGTMGLYGNYHARLQPIRELLSRPREAALPSREAFLPRAEMRSYFTQFNIDQHTYQLDRNRYCDNQEHLRNVPRTNQGCTLMGLAMMNHLYQEKPLDPCTIDALLAQGAHVDAQVRRRLGADTFSGLEQFQVFSSLPAGTFPHVNVTGMPVQSMGRLSPGSLESRASFFEQKLRALIEDIPSTEPIAVMVAKGGHFITLFLGREQSGVRSVSLFDTRDCFDDGVRPHPSAAGPKGAVFMPLPSILRGNFSAAGRRMAELLPCQEEQYVILQYIPRRRSSSS